jgi:hypothetical protein
MPILRLVSRDAGRQLYDAAIAEIDLEHEHPLGLIMHGAAEVDGRMQVAQVWASEEYARHFDEVRLMPALEAVGAPTEADVTVFELHHLVTP